MKKLLCIVALLVIAGCQQNPAAWQMWNDSAGRSLQRAIEAETSYGHIRQISPPSSTGNSTYWQEERARQQWWDRQYEGMGIRRY